MYQLQSNKPLKKKKKKKKKIKKKKKKKRAVLNYVVQTVNINIISINIIIR